MQIHVINPNTTASMTDKIGACANRVAAEHTQIHVSQPDSGPVSIESHFDEAVSAVGVLEEIRRGEALGMDAYVIACFGDPGLLAARELTRAPVIGIAEAGFHLAALISTRFSVVTTLARTAIIAEHLLDQYGFRHNCRRVRATDLPVLELENPAGNAYQALLEECQRARDEDGIGAIVLGCGGMADLTERLAHDLQMPVVEGVSAAVKLAESLVSLGLGTSKHGDLAFPRPKPFSGRFADWGV
ncbi:MAG: aspartate/glutamate racemase family protein [Salinicola sp.]|uniref:aspartate/glutamate racemase family protein n=1 Tax=Salinicola sp. TaxID=1978524 RepID=UPI001E160556|nr:aspartate/glutamate racemase family protein [Salinicola sp.]NRB54884.1 aspartate/glutamate racemase family protein [Salinicola sp.]